MTNPNGRKGREAELDVARYLRETCGIDGAARDSRRRGRYDQGDIEGWPGVTVEVKARQSSRVPSWLRELRKEMGNGHTALGALVVKVPGTRNAARYRWWVAQLGEPELFQADEDATWHVSGPHDGPTAVAMLRQLGA